MTLTRDWYDHILYSQDSHEILHCSSANFVTPYSLVSDCNENADSPKVLIGKD